ncbi:hypothetical protein Kpol_1054p14 [Vanderwaltozyma polyspora DSM 70294]|uniref:Uncharacterized protein n=1 Tax=Vanderwaltozyma polyspora (strain ATCC 22028 / DSM 70294 / BCRC 21397 / CBS 2163 / NBRC 10782 / NRRL Y-8283 / UCD 57-17) TaxID=436907 RepID=A7TIA1_VANPO|nr:uncharacterized protein Kpol_1054p14 [Vanderwaltozyma polyspora DSM 70294]EDO17967.1 hypothetical protein Kpol_1054p14 [Vanderwaltozyma polyspora DSM 70294]
MLYSSRFLEIDIPDSFWKIQKLPSATRAITSIYLVLSIFLLFIRYQSYSQLDEVTRGNTSFAEITFPILQMVPDKMKYYPFSIVLSNFIDTELWKFIINLLNLSIGGAYIERNWGSSREIFKFTILLGTITNVVVVLFTFAMSFIFDGISLSKPIDGNYTILIGFPIIYKQLLPETTIFEIKNIPLISKNFRFKLLPIFVICVVTLVQLIWLHHFAQLISIWLSFVSCWVYLRFYQTLSLAGDNSNAEVAFAGDTSDTFQFIYLFPDVVKPLLRPIFDLIYDIVCVKLRLIRPLELSDIEKGNSIAEQRGAKPLEGSATSKDEERRRQKALEVLQERMS